MLDNMAQSDFNRAYRRGFWRKIGAWLGGKSNDLLPYDEVRRELPLKGQWDIGLQTIPLDKIVGSVGRYRDFDRAFLPKQRETSQRWVSISKARYQDVELPPIEAYQIDDVYFVRDGNHRVSVARERSQDFIDAYVTRIDIPVELTPDMELADVLRRKSYAQFRLQTRIDEVRPEADLELTLTEEYDRLLSHIDAHRYYLSMEQGYEVPYQEAVGSWYDNVYVPLVESIEQHDLPGDLQGYSPTDLYLFVSEYQWLLREESDADGVVQQRVDQMISVYNEKSVRQVAQYLRRANWISQAIVAQDRADFLAATRLNELRPGAAIELSFPGKYYNLLQHINNHQYYLGLERKNPIPFEEAVASFYDNIYLPLLEIVREQNFMDDFPRRTEDDLVLWILDHRRDLVEALDSLPRPDAD